MPVMTNHEPPPTEPAPADRDWFGGRRWTGIAALGMIIVTLLCVVIVLAINHGGGTQSTDTGAGAPPATSTRPTTTRTSSAPPTTTVPTTGPSGTVWTIFDTVALPSIPGQGPAHVDGALATGYAHTPTGALLAAVNEMYRVLVAGDRPNWRSAVDAMVAPGPGKDALLREVGTAAPAQPAQSGEYSQVQGFQFVSYTPSDAVIQIATRDARGVLQTGPLHVSWNGSDWQWVPPASGVGTSQTTTSLQGFIPWSGV